MSHDNEPLYYVYILARPNGKAFYVGKGKDLRVFHHEKEARGGCKCHKCNVIRKIWRNSGEVQRYIVFTTNDETEALNHEIELIALFGRKNLTNQTDGGDGVAALSIESNERRRRKLKERWTDPDIRARQIAVLEKARPQAIAATQTPAHREKMRASTARLWRDKGYRAKVLTARHALWQTDEHREMMRASTQTPEFRAKISRVMRRNWQNTDYRAHMVGKPKTEEHRAALRESAKRRWDDTDYRARMAVERRSRFDDPDYKAHIVAGLNAPEARDKLRAIMRTPEYRAKVSAAVKAARARKKQS